MQISPEFPVVFHDHTGSYVEAYERPPHPYLMSALCTRGPGLTNARPHTGDTVEGDVEDCDDVGHYSSLGEQLDASMGARKRVSLLIGFLTQAKATAHSKKSMKGVKLGVLARVPTTTEGSSTSTTTSPSCTTPEHGLCDTADLENSFAHGKRSATRALDKFKQYSDEMDESLPIDYETDDWLDSIAHGL